MVELERKGFGGLGKQGENSYVGGKKPKENPKK